MATKGLISKVLEIDIVLAGVDPGDTVLTMPNPEGRDLVLVRSSIHIITTDLEQEPGANLIFEISGTPWTGGLAIAGSAVSGGAIDVGNSEWLMQDGSSTVWHAESNLLVILDEALGAAPTFVGKLYVEYWGSDRVLGTSYSKQHASVYRGIRRAL